MSAESPEIRIETTEEGPVARRLEVAVAPARVRQAFDRAYRELARSARVRGFRPGRAPRSVLERLYGHSVAEQIEQKLVAETLPEALEQAGIEAVAEPAIDAAHPSEDREFRYTARVEVRPAIEVPDTNGLPARRPRVEVAPEEVESELDALRQRNAPVVEEPEGTRAARGHVLVIDFAGEVEERAFEGGNGKAVEVELGAGRFLPDFEAQLEGAVAGEDRELRVRFPEDYARAQLAGKEALFRVHVSEVDGWVECATDLVVLPAPEPTPEELVIARHVTALVEDGATLQFGIGAIPDEIARILAERPMGGFGIHTEMISDGVMRLHEAGKVANRKPLYDGFSVATFALGSSRLYRWLDGNPYVRMLPVTEVNEPSVLCRLPRLTSVNGALSIDLAGQVAADSVGGRQYSGVGGHESFTSGAAAAPEGRSFLCLKSTAKVGGTRVSTIVPAFSEGTCVTTPRHHVHYVVTEHGAVDLCTLSDVERPRALVELAHPDFRASLRASLR